jgi:NAD(P)-dependent dehydrogenase (short-subunit alcohol dehydrogenase family)
MVLSNLKQYNMVITRNHDFAKRETQPDIAGTHGVYDPQEMVDDLNEIRVDDDLQEPNPEENYEPTTLPAEPTGTNEEKQDTFKSIMSTEQQTTILNGQSVLITGGTTGIGRELALKIAAMGGNVLIAGVNEQHLDDTISDSHQANLTGRLNGIIADLSPPVGVDLFFKEADKLFDGPLDVLINNAALAFQSAMEGSFEDWRKVIDTNLLGYIACTHEAAARMLKNGRGHIVFIGSMSAEVREKDSSIYVATKSGVEGFAASLRKELNDKGIRVTLIQPGAVDTDMQPQSTAEKKSAAEQHEMLYAADIAAAVIYALSQDERCNVAEVRLKPRLQII